MPIDPQHDEQEDPVEALVFQTLERMERDGSAAIESAVSDHPELERELRSRLKALQAMGLVDAPLEAPTAVPERVASFAIGKPLGEGGMGLIFEAHDPTLNRTVAIKLIRPQYCARQSLRERFVREGQAIARLQHPSIARVFQVGEEDETPFIAMERVYGCTVAALLDATLAEGRTLRGTRTGQDFLRIVRKLSDAAPGTEQAGQEIEIGTELFAGTWDQVVARVCREVAEGLQHAHSAGVLHRDVKASNIMVTPSGRVLLIDFGLAQLDTAATMTVAGGHIGSLPYTAPERITPGSHSLKRAGLDSTTLGTASDSAPNSEQGDGPTALADVYSLGVVMYEMLALKLPFRASSEAALIASIVEGQAKPVSGISGAGNSSIAAITERTMRRDPARRTPSAAALAHDLSRALAGQAPVAHGDGLVAALRSRWRAQPWLSSGVVLAGLLLLALPTIVLALRAQAAERIADSGQVSLRRLGLALEATHSLKDALPKSPIIKGTSLETLRMTVLQDLAEFEARVASDWPEGASPALAGPVSEPHSPAVHADREMIRRAHQLLDAAKRTKDGQLDLAEAKALVEDMNSIRAQTSRSLDLEAALLELMQALLAGAELAGDKKNAEHWRAHASELCTSLGRSLPGSVWLEARKAELAKSKEDASL